MLLPVVVFAATLRASSGFDASRRWRGRLTRPGAALAAQTPGGDDSLPLNWRSDNGTRDDEFSLAPRSALKKTRDSTKANGGAGGAMVKLESNPYVQIVSSLSPGEMIGRFADTAPQQVQDAVRSTIVGLLGSTQSFALETATVMTGERLANLMFQLQMTGYMFKNAEYRISLAQSLENSHGGKVSGTITVDYGGMKVSVDADAYMSELRAEVEDLRAELAKVDAKKASTANKDLLAYIAKMPQEQMNKLTSEITEDVLDGMKKLVYSIMRSMGTSTVTPDTLLQQSGSAMTQLLLWQLAIGYNLREMEVRDQLKTQLQDPKD